MKRLTILLLLVLAFGFIGCQEDSGPSGPTIITPTGLTAVAQSGTQVYLTWVCDTPLESGYRLQRSVTGSESWIQVAELEVDVLRYTDASGLEEGTHYTYRVKAFNAQRESDWSNPVNVLTLAEAPTNLTAIQDTSIDFNTIKLTWNDNSAKETGYEVQRKLGSSGTFEVVGTTVADSAWFLNSGLTSGSKYYYHVHAMIDSIASLSSNDASVTVRVFTPPAPSSLTAEALGANSIYLTWDDNAENNDGFIVERSLIEIQDYDSIDSTGANTESYTDEGLLDETTFYYRVVAYNVYGRSAYSNVASATTPAGPPLPPSNLQAVNITYYAVTLNWTDESNDEDYFQINRMDRGSWRRDYSTVGPNLTVFTDTTITMNTAYGYRIRAHNAAGFSTTWTVMDEITTPNGPPEAPRNLEAVTLSISSIRLSWAPGRSGNQDSYILERKSEQSEGIWEQIGGELARETASYTDTGLREGTWYWYRILGLNEIGSSPYSAIDSTDTWSVIVLADGFENHPTGSPPPAPWEVTDRGGSTTRVTDVLAHNGIKSVMLQDQNPDQIDSACTGMRTDTRQVSIGQLRTWLYIAPNGYFGTFGFDEDDYYTYRIQFNPNASFYIQHGSLWVEATGHTYPQGEWFELVIDWNTNTGLYNVSFNETLHVRGASLQRLAAHAGNNGVWFWTYYSTVIDYVYIDDVEIRDTTDEQQGLSTAPFLPDGGIGDAKVSDVIWVEEARP